MAKIIRFHKTGGPEVLQMDDVPVGDPGAGQARIRHTAIGVNFIDIYQRSGLYPMTLPSGTGNEGAGVVEAVGPGVTSLKPGDRVAYTGAPPGSYCDVRLFAADRLVKVPEGISDQQAASMMLKGMTAWYLIHRTYAVKPGDTVLWHAAAGGVGTIACQWLKAIGAKIIGTVGSDEKAAIAKAHGCDHVIVYTRENFTERVKEITGGKGVPVVYDSWQEHLDGSSIACGRGDDGVFQQCLARWRRSTSACWRKRVAVRDAPVAVRLHRHAKTEAARDMFDVVRSGKVKISITEVKLPTWRRRTAISRRKTTGSVIPVVATAGRRSARSACVPLSATAPSTIAPPARASTPRADPEPHPKWREHRFGERNRPFLPPAGGESRAT